jgi:hemerythrin
MLWRKKYTLNVPIIDIQHMRLFSLIDQLSTCLKEDDEAYLDGILQELRQYTHYHFDTEEALFNRTDYDKAANHHEQHRLFGETVERYYRTIQEGQSEAKLEALCFLQNWWTVHVQEVDRGYVPYLLPK